MSPRIPHRDEVPSEYTWDLTPLFRDIAVWQDELAKLEPRIAEFAKRIGSLGESAANLESAVREYLDTTRSLERIYTYAHLLSDEDTTNAQHLALLETARNLSSRWNAASSFLTPEILSIPGDILEHFLAEPELQDLRRMIEEIVRYRPHTLSKEEENLLALGGEVLAAPGHIFSQLHNADLEFGTVTVDGEERPITHSSYTWLLQHRNRTVREQTFLRYARAFKAHQHTIAATLSSSIKRDVFLAKARKFPSALNAALFGDAVDEQVYDNLVTTVSQHLTPLHRYYALRQRVLNLRDLQIYDTYVPLVPDVDTRFPFEKAVRIVVEALAPLGREYVEKLHSGLTTERWVDVLENRGKRSGAYSAGCYDSPPYMLLNYKESHLHDLFTLAHEAGHSMHTYLSSHAQKYQDSSYTIFVAEVASTFNEQLLLKYLKDHFSDNPAMLAYLVNQEIDDIKATLYRQTMFAEFERITHEIAERNEPLTVDTFRQVYRTLLEKYFGPQVNIHVDADLECLRIPHFYSAFYVYKYATGISAAISLCAQLVRGDPQTQDRYLRFLSAGCTKHPIDLLRDAGVDMASPAPIEASLNHFESLVRKLEQLLEGSSPK